MLNKGNRFQKKVSNIYITSRKDPNHTGHIYIFTNKFLSCAKIMNNLDIQSPKVTPNMYTHTPEPIIHFCKHWSNMSQLFASMKD